MNKINIDKNILVDLYKNNGYSQKKCGEILKCSQTTIGNYLDKYNIQKRNYGTHSKSTLIVEECKGIKIEKMSGYYPYGYIDHQSYEDYKSLADFLDDWNVDIKHFLFDDNIKVYIGNDNG